MSWSNGTDTTPYYEGTYITRITYSFNPFMQLEEPACLHLKARINKNGSKCLECGKFVKHKRKVK